MRFFCPLKTKIKLTEQFGGGRLFQFYANTLLQMIVKQVRYKSCEQQLINIAEKNTAILQQFSFGWSSSVLSSGNKESELQFCMSIVNQVLALAKKKIWLESFEVAFEQAMLSRHNGCNVKNQNNHISFWWFQLQENHFVHLEITKTRNKLQKHFPDLKIC